MVHLRSNQRLYISEDLRGYVDKLIDDGTIPYAVDFLQLGFAHAIREELEPATVFERHTITTNTDILGDSKLAIEAIAQWHARRSDLQKPKDSDHLLDLICSSAIEGGRHLRRKWSSRSKSQVHELVASLCYTN